MRRTRLLAQIGLLAALTVLALPSSGFAFAGYPIALTSSGASPTDATISGAEYPVWDNQDTVAHTVTFEDGCSFQVAPGASAAGSCRDSWSAIGTHTYTVDGTNQATLTHRLSHRRVTLNSKRHGFRLGSRVRLHGTLEISYDGSPPPRFGPRMPVMVFARRDRSHPWHRIAVVQARPLKKPRSQPYSVWSLWVRPRAHTTYVVEAASQPNRWEKARSRLFGLYVRH